MYSSANQVFQLHSHSQATFFLLDATYSGCQNLPGMQILSLTGQMTTKHVGGALSLPPKGTDLGGTE